MYIACKWKVFVYAPLTCLCWYILLDFFFEASMGEHHKDFKEPEEISNVKSTNGPFAARDQLASDF